MIFQNKIPLDLKSSERGLIPIPCYFSASSGYLRGWWQFFKMPLNTFWIDNRTQGLFRYQRGSYFGASLYDSLSRADFDTDFEPQFIWFDWCAFRNSLVVRNVIFGIKSKYQPRFARDKRWIDREVRQKLAWKLFLRIRITWCKSEPWPISQVWNLAEILQSKLQKRSSLLTKVLPYLKSLTKERKIFER